MSFVTRTGYLLLLGYWNIGYSMCWACGFDGTQGMHEEFWWGSVLKNCYLEGNDVDERSGIFKYRLWRRELDLTGSREGI